MVLGGRVPTQATSPVVEVEGLYVSEEELMSPEMRASTTMAMRRGIPGYPNLGLCPVCAKRLKKKKLSRHVLEQHAPVIIAYKCIMCYLYMGPRLRTDKSILTGDMQGGLRPIGGWLVWRRERG